MVGVRDFGMEQQRVEPPVGRRHRRDRRVRARRGHVRSPAARLSRSRRGSPRRAGSDGTDREERRVRRDARSWRGRTRGAAPAPPRRRARASSAACRSRCRAPGTPASKTPASQCGAPASETLFGPPDRMMPTGARSRNLRERRVERQDFGVDRQLAQAARDQLGELRAEVEDDDGLMGHGESAIIRCASRGHHHIL